MMEKRVILGRYRHFKGGLYRVEGIARHSESGEEMVVYRSETEPEKLWVRPLSMWNETVERDGKTFCRFEKLEDRDETV